MQSHPDLGVKLFVDSGDVSQIKHWILDGTCHGATSNPSLARKAGVGNYLEFCQRAAEVCGLLPMSLEVVADDGPSVMRQARLLAAMGSNVAVKVPIVSTDGQSNIQLIRELADEGIRVNVTAMFTERHIETVWQNLHHSQVDHFASIFCGRIYDSGRDAAPIVRRAVKAFANTSTKIIWASVRQPYDIILASQNLVDVVTVFPDMLKKLHLFGKDLDEFARETSAMFARDAAEAGYSL